MKTKLATLALLAACSAAFAQTSKPATLMDDAKPSLVVVRFTYEGEMGRRDLDAMGLVVREDGLTIVSSEFTPRQMPDEQMKDFKLVIPGDEEKEIDAVLLGRDDRYNLSFIAPKEALKTPMKPLSFSTDAITPGDHVRSVGLLPKSAGFAPTCTRRMSRRRSAGRCRRCWSTARA
ncbi:MAG: hypothetical protein QM754_00970 [Tepidisphaeraceae bacterium]